jgi:protein ImuB
LIERLRVRLGSSAVLFPMLAASHLPEKAFALTETPKPSAPAIPRRFKSRPLFLLPEPAEIRCMVSPSAINEGIPLAFVYDNKSFSIVHASGPERISGTWWEGRNKTREYFDVQETTGRRFWIFRVTENKRWFLQGVFDG